jgi:DNA-binding MarR family transcriptional regulator
MHKTKVSRAVRALKGRRSLQRREVPQDRREELLTVTRLGQEAYAEIIPRAIAVEQSLRERLGEDAGPARRSRPARSRCRREMTVTGRARK